MPISLRDLQSAVNNLKQALSLQNPSDLERDGTVQRFEYCYKILWKSAQRILKDNEIDSDTPKEVFRQLGRLGWIDNVEQWLEFQKSRNETSHECGLKLAEKSYALAKTFLPLALDLLKVLDEKNRV